MEIDYNPAQIEPKWQKVWEENKLNLTPEPSESRPKKYVLDMFPYPSGAQLHVGHMEGYVGTDVVSRYFRMKGYSVLHPMGWDAFGLPAENYAIKTGVLPNESTHKNIETFKKQLNLLGLSYDWSREIDTSSPDYYKWTQWLFIQLFKRGLAYKKKAPANWCPKDETVLANEQVIDSKCERCGTEVVQKELDQWFFKITAYADKLIEDLDKIDWPKATKLMQKNWIGKKEGINVTYEINGVGEDVTVFTTAPVNFGMTFLVLAPEHELVTKIVTGKIKVPTENKENVAKYVETAKKKTDKERIAEGREKTGAFTGLYANNRINGKKVPVWVSDFVLSHVGTGAVQGCPGHDVKDWQFAKKFGIPIVRVIVGPDGDMSPIDRQDQIIEHGMAGTFVNSDWLNGLDFETGLQKTMDYFQEKGWGKRVATYHLRDWLVSRQRYWGAPIPMIFCEKCQWQPVPEKELPVVLPTDVDFLPHGESPIARSKTFQVGVKCPNCGGKARREVDTMDTFVDSSWYFLRFLDPANKKEFASADTINSWMPVDIYVGGGHTVQHLLFARFFQKALVDAGLINKSIDEPFTKLVVPGWILGRDSRKMSKRWNNVITPDDVVAKFGADTMRLYEMFMAPFEVDKPWSVNSVAGVHRFVNRIYDLFNKTRASSDLSVDPEIVRLLNRTINKVGSDIETFNFNTAVSTMMELINVLEKSSNMMDSKKYLTGLKWGELWQKFILVLAPFAPHLAEELWQQLIAGPAARQPTVTASPRKKSRAAGAQAGARLALPAFISIHRQSWPVTQRVTEVEEKRTIVISVDGKPRATMIISSQELRVLGEKEIVVRAQSVDKVAKYLAEKTIIRTVYVAGKIINFVTE